MILSRYRYRLVTIPLPFSGHRDPWWHSVHHRDTIVPHRPWPFHTVYHGLKPFLTIYNCKSSFQISFSRKYLQYDRSSLRNRAFKLLLIYLEQKVPRPNLSKNFLKTSIFFYRFCILETISSFFCRICFLNLCFNKQILPPTQLKETNL